MVTVDDRVVHGAEVEINGKVIGTTDGRGYSPPFFATRNERLCVHVHINGKVICKTFDCTEPVIEFPLPGYLNHRNEDSPMVPRKSVRH